MPPLRPTPPPWQQRCQTCCRALLRRLAGFAQWLPWALGALMFCVGAGAAEVPDGVAQQVAAGAAVDVIVEYDATAVELALARLRARRPRGVSDDALLALTSQRYQQVKSAADSTLTPPDTDIVQDYSHLPMRLLRVHSPSALAALAAHPGIRAIYANGRLQRVQAQSDAVDQVQIDQPAVAGVGYGGAGTTVAVIDDGIELTNAAFGCTAVGTPTGCRIVANQTIVANPGTDFTHGTNVSAIVTEEAGLANVAMLNVFSASGAQNSDVIAGINWAIANRSSYNIVAINMSLGDSSHNTSTCSRGNSFLTPVSNAMAAGISVVAAAGNNAYVNSVFTPGLSSPACTPGVISVGAVYDGNLGGLIWGSAPDQCTDYTTQTDQIACFSQSATYLSLLAPGALVTAAGITDGGTSQATPHVAAGVAILRAAFPNDTLATTLARLTTSSVQITDSRNSAASVTTPRLLLDAAARPANDNFASRISLTGASGSTTGVNLLATLQSGEPQPATAGTNSVWWSWTAPASGQLTLGSNGSDFNALLGVYSGSTLASLVPVANNAASSGSGTATPVLFEAQSGLTYQWQVQSANGIAGTIALQWSLNSAASAALTSSTSGPGAAAAGSTIPVVITVRNGGPQSATNVEVSFSIPAGATLASTPGGCTASATGLTCAAGTLANGATASWTLDLNIVTPGLGLTFTTSATSDLPDPNSAAATSTLSLQTTSSADNGEIPLPAWALALLASGLLGTLAHTARGARSSAVRRPGDTP